MKMIFHSHSNKTHLYKKGFALSLVLKVRVFTTRKWYIKSVRDSIRKKIKKSCNEEHRGYVSQGLEDFPLELKWRRTQRILSTRKYSCNWRKVDKNWHEKSMRLINK